MEIRERVSAALGERAGRAVRLTGGCIAEVWKLELGSGGRVVAKVAGPDGTLDVEAFMLRYLAEHSELPVPRVLHGERDLLVMEFVEGESRFSEGAERHAAVLLAALHSVRGEAHGFERDTLIGPLRQANTQRASWAEFFRDQRLLYMAGVAGESGNLPARTRARIERLCARIGEFIEEPEHPSLLHGDVWTTNVLAADDRVTAFIDPAIYYGHPEIELAFTTLFGTFGRAFFDRYSKLRPISPGFFERRRDIYNLYPLLVHTALFGGGYAAQVEGILAREGF
jgi:fructosamine-3-kinase